MKKKLIIIFILAFLVIPLYNQGSSAASDSIKWYSYGDAVTLGEKNTNKIFLYFYSTRCYFCGLMEKNTFSNSAVVQYLNQNFIPVKVDSDREKNISNTYNIKGSPTNYFLTEKFEVIGRLPGYLPPQDLLNILKYVHTNSFKKMTFRDFLKKQTVDSRR